MEIAAVLFAEKELQDKSVPVTALSKENAVTGKVHPYSFSHTKEGAALAVLSLDLKFLLEILKLSKNGKVNFSE